MTNALHWPIASTLFVTLLGAPAIASAPEPVSTILEVSGPVSVKAPGAAEFQPASGGQALFTGAVVRTGARGHARLRWQNGGDFRLMPLSEIKIADPDAVETTQGQIWSQFTEKLLRPFFFRSPSATAVVRGTTLAFGVDGEGATRVVVSEGKVEVSGRDGRTLFLTGGQAVRSAPDGRLGTVEPMGQEEQPPFEGSAAPAKSLPAEPEARPRESGQRGWARLDDWTRRGLDWLESHRASERMPALRQEMTVRTRPAAGPQAPADGRPQAPGDQWPASPASKAG
ncbi:MAG: FecR domain-containing protein, partial [Candidatus Sericytochromatia bacterium]